MRRSGLLLVALVALFSFPAPPAQAQTPRLTITPITLSTAIDWQRGTLDGLLISSNEDGELRLDASSARGQWTSEPIDLGAGIFFNALGASWELSAEGLPQGTSLSVELRGAPDAAALLTVPWELLQGGDTLTGDGIPAAELPRPAACYCSD